MKQQTLVAMVLPVIDSQPLRGHIMARSIDCVRGWTAEGRRFIDIYIPSEEDRWNGVVVARALECLNKQGWTANIHELPDVNLMFRSDIQPCAIADAVLEVLTA